MTVFHPGQVVYWAWNPGEVFLYGPDGSVQVRKGTVVVRSEHEPGCRTMVYCKLDGEEAYMHVSSTSIRFTRDEIELEITAALLEGRKRG